MANLNFDVVVKIGSMALIRQEDNDLDYNIFARLGAQLKPGYILVSSGATEIGRLDYMKRNNGNELKGDIEEVKTDYAAQGQSILMENYRQFIKPIYSIRQVLVEHSHFNDEEKREHIKKLLFRAANQNAIPIVNYNDAVSSEENRKMELAALRKKEENIVECIDNDETAAVIATLVQAKIFIMLTSVYGIYKDPKDPSTLINEVTAPNMDQLIEKLTKMMEYCKGASREGTAGAISKLKFAQKPLECGSTVIIAHAKYKLDDIIQGKVKRTLIKLKED